MRRYIHFERINDDWIEGASIELSVDMQFEYFGHKMRISKIYDENLNEKICQKRVIVSVFYGDTYIFDYNEITDTCDEIAELFPSDPNTSGNDDFGSAVAICDNTALVGSYLRAGKISKTI